MIDHHARAEDLRWLADHGETATDAARRMGLTLDALEKWARNHARADWARLLDNQHRPDGHGARRGRVLA